MIYLECPAELVEGRTKLFLAGGVTSCRDWQSEVIAQIDDLDIIVLNPRRKTFNVTDKQMEWEQIHWEFKMLSKADVIAFYFCRETVCPITLYELGRYAALDKRIIVGMDNDYSRRNDVEIQLSLAKPELKVIWTSIDNFIRAIRRNFTTIR
ncbi:MAG: nucleoside 2-deoxyribosyltransferase domain-containing protein [Candidatus Nanoarchaeia archaeon]|nr:nucleoside 2-deoxyribosyltransferase domain-containing protein [Candidatus Nanoarchaeia archaeon]